MSELCLGNCQNCPKASELSKKIADDEAMTHRIGLNALDGVFGRLTADEIFVALNEEGEEAVRDDNQPGKLIVAESVDELARILRSNIALYMRRQDWLIEYLEHDLTEMTKDCIGPMEIRKSPYSLEIVQLCRSPLRLGLDTRSM